ncbi:MAG: AMP-dependent synthetase and ligase [Myxococcaceae bacterium]|nr:AMP-dependent synthetase and ligase [Myxococcaceae bacterium]
MTLERLRRAFEQAGTRELLAGAHGATTYAEWLSKVTRAPVEQVHAGDVVACRIEATSLSIASVWALLERKAIVALLGSADDWTASCALVGADWTLDQHGSLARTSLEVARHPLYQELAQRGHPGLVLLTSGTTGVPKVAVHDADQLLGKFVRRGRDLRTLLFLPLEHIGGLDTLMYAMSNGSTLVIPESRSVEHVCAAIAAHRAEVLATNPSFLNLLLLHHASQTFDLTSLQVVSYGAEVMPQTTLDRIKTRLPDVKLVQRYGSTEFGALRTQARADGSAWLKWGADVESRVIDGRLYIKTATTMLGYLNASSPVSDDGWVATGDSVEQDGDYFRILGRLSDIINVGGEKVFPIEVEDVLMQLPDVVDAVAFGEPNPLLGQVVSVQLVYRGEARGAELSALVRRHCASKLARYKVPMRVRAVEELARSAQKKLRPHGAPGSSTGNGGSAR